MSKILIVGDSHGNQFAHCTRAVHYILPRDQVLNADRFVQGYPPVFATLEPWLAAQAIPGPVTMVLSVGEVDIRGHYWRQLPRFGTVDQYVRDRARELYSAMRAMVDRYGIQRIVLWGAPPACANVQYNPHWPFSGSVTVRNMIINAFNREFVQLVDDSVGFATAYYAYIDPKTYLPHGHMPTDGVHWGQELTSEFWRQLILPALSGSTSVIANRSLFHSMSSDSYSYAVTEVTKGTRLYDSWILGSDCDTQCTQLGQTWSYRLQHQLASDSSYQELSLVAKSQI